ncbi:MAG: XdhC family protein [Verrucomicrobiota bacterium]|nr:XdhC family protein [Verrucomicrobiota bacterium]MDQ6939474.1 XdhC family protein [Verrucomicrobiota bacterium]
MTDALLAELIAAREARLPCALVTVAAATGSVPRAAGSKMLVYADGKISGTIGGGKFEALVRDEAIAALHAKKTLLKSYPLHEGEPDSFGAICGGEATVLIEPQILNEAIFLVGGGHCAKAIAKLAADCGFFVTVIDDREESLGELPPLVKRLTNVTPADFIRSHAWQSDEALVMVSRNHEIDREALAVAVEQTGAGYIGMIGSKRKVRMVFDALRERGISDEKLARVYAPLGLDIGSDSPAEIAISTMAEIVAVLRGRSGGHMRQS